MATVRVPLVLVKPVPVRLVISSPPMSRVVTVVVPVVSRLMVLEALLMKPPVKVSRPLAVSSWSLRRKLVVARLSKVVALLASNAAGTAPRILRGVISPSASILTPR